MCGTTKGQLNRNGSSCGCSCCCSCLACEGAPALTRPPTSSLLPPSLLRLLSSLKPQPVLIYSLSLARISESRKRWYSCSDVAQSSQRCSFGQRVPRRGWTERAPKGTTSGLAPDQTLRTLGATHLLADLDGDAAERGEDDAVALLERDGRDRAVLAGCAGPDSEDGALGGRGLRGGRGEVQARGGLLLVGGRRVCVSDRGSSG